MMKVLLLIYLSSSCLVMSCQAQGNNKFEYIFPIKVNQEIDKAIDVYENKPEWHHYLTINRVFNGDNCGNYIVTIQPYNEEPSETVRDLLSKNSHYYRYGKVKIPIVFDYDFQFVGYGSDAKGRVIRKSVITHGGYDIEFTIEGEIVKNE